MKFTVLQAGADTGGKSLDLHWELLPHCNMKEPLVHVHPHAIETYEVLEGEMEFFIKDNLKTPQKDKNGDTYFSCQFDISPTKANHRSIFDDGYNIKVRGAIVYLRSKSMSKDRLRFKLTHLGNSIITIDKNFN